MTAWEALAWTGVVAIWVVLVLLAAAIIVGILNNARNPQRKQSQRGGDGVTQIMSGGDS